MPKPNHGFAYASTPDGQHMIMCREDCYKARTVARLFREFFPTLSRRDVKGVRVVEDQKLCPTDFGYQIGVLTETHDWNEKPVVALRLVKEDGKKYCSAEAVF